MRTAILALAALPLSAAILNVSVDVTPTQAVLRYLAPNWNACTVQASESVSLTPLVHDVDTTLFAGSNLDSRTGSISYGRERAFVLGKRAAEAATDGRRYSRALQAFTSHTFRITCGSDVYTGTFKTRNIPLGLTFPETYPVDPLHPGEYAWPTQKLTQNTEYHVDPLTGALVERITGAGTSIDGPYTNLSNLGAFDDSGSSNPWTVTGSVLPATYAADGTARPKLYVPADMTSVGVATPLYTLDPVAVPNYATVSITGTATGTGDNAKVTVCLTIDGVTCAAGSPNSTGLDSGSFGATSSTLTVGDTNAYWTAWFGGLPPAFAAQDLAKRANTVATYNNTTGALAWSSGYYFGRKWAAGTRVWISGTPYKLSAYTWPTSATISSGLGLSSPTVVGQSFGVLIWKKTGTGSVTISQVKFNVGKSRAFTFWNSGYARQCSPQSATLGGEKGYYCALYAEYFSWLGVNGSVRHLGLLEMPAQSADSHGNAWSRSAFWNGVYHNADTTNPLTIYSIYTDTGSKKIVLRSTYTGPGADLATINYNSDTFPSTVTNLTPTNPLDAPSGQYNLSALVTRFDSRTVIADDATMTCRGFGVQGTKFFISCWHGQDSPPGYIIVFDTSITASDTTNPVVGVFDLQDKGARYVNPARWGVLHGASMRNAGWLSITENNSTDAKMQTTLAQSMGSSGTDVYVTGDPGSGALDIARAGDTFTIGTAGSDYEVMQIASIAGVNHWVVTRDWGAQSLGSFAHSSGATVNMIPSGSGLGAINWDYVNDPLALNANGLTVVAEGLSLGHPTWGAGNDYVWTYGTTAECLAAVGTDTCLASRIGAMPTALGQPPQSLMMMWPTFAGIRKSVYLSETHPGKAQDDASLDNLNWIIDSRPIIGASYYAASMTAVSATSNLYKTSDTMHPKLLSTFASCGSHVLFDASPGPITDTTGDYWKYCHGASCYTGASSGDTYVNCPGRVVVGCSVSTNEAANGEEAEDICIGDGGWPLGSPAVQIDRTVTDPASKYQRALTYGFQRFKHQAENYWSNGKATPDGSWATFTTRWSDDQRSDLMMVKIPPLPPADSVNRASFIPVRVTVGSVPTGTSSVAVKFGYGPTFYCSSRSEACYATATAVSESAPFYWASEAASGLSCASGCTVTIPAISSRVLYYQVEYRNSGGSVITSGPAQVTAIQ